MNDTVLIGTYTTTNSGGDGEAEGLFVYQMDKETGRLEKKQAVDSGPNPSFITTLDGGRFVYAANEQDGGSVSALRMGEDGLLTMINSQPVKGDAPCYVSLDPSGGWVLAACYTSGSFTVFPLGEDKHLEPAVTVVQNEGSGPNKDRQDHAHAHSIRFSPEGNFVLGVDLGIDFVGVYRFDGQSGALTPNDPVGFHTRPGAGPRHLELSADGRFVYIANELDSTVTVCAWDAQTGRLDEVQTLSTLEAGFEGENTVADIHRTPSGAFLYISNRGENTLTAFRIDPSSGRLTKIGSFSSGGEIPRNFAIDPRGKFLLAANQKSGNVVVFTIEDDGRLTDTGEEVELAAPVCVIFPG